MACAKSVGKNLSTVAVRWADMVRILIRSRVPKFYFFILSPTLSKETFNCPRGESELVESHPLISFLSAELSLCRLGRHCPRCRKGIGANAGLHTVPAFGARLFPTLSNEVSSLCVIGKLSPGMECSYCCMLASVSHTIVCSNGFLEQVARKNHSQICPHDLAWIFVTHTTVIWNRIFKRLS
jgi:hypothetical protein